jgi:hypothetical protein
LPFFSFNSCSSPNPPPITDCHPERSAVRRVVEGPAFLSAVDATSVQAGQTSPPAFSLRTL